MELFTAIALLCQINNGDAFSSTIRTLQLECHQYYVHCVSTKPVLGAHEALKKCILEKK